MGKQILCRILCGIKCLDVGNSKEGHLRVDAKERPEAVAAPLDLCDARVLRLKQLDPLSA